jgi:hypothetical protein
MPDGHERKAHQWHLLLSSVLQQSVILPAFYEGCCPEPAHLSVVLYYLSIVYANRCHKRHLTTFTALRKSVSLPLLCVSKSCKISRSLWNNDASVMCICGLPLENHTTEQELCPSHREGMHHLTLYKQQHTNRGLLCMLQ